AQKLNGKPLAAFTIYTLFARTGLRIMASRAGEYRRRAKKCLEMAGTFRDREARATLTHMAEVWLRLADDYEDANERFRRSKVAEKGQPIVQQQQQIQPTKDDFLLAYYARMRLSERRARKRGCGKPTSLAPLASIDVCR